jgi:LysR family transcriptional regulator, carnitine catabolism transcriptional activator
MDLSTRQLRAFAALAESRNFTRAAERTHLSQPAFSALIRGLEQSVGTRLFDRSTRHVELTPEGVLFGEFADQLLVDFDGALTDLRDRVARRKGRVALAALPSLSADWLPAVLAAFRMRHPGIELDLIDTLADDCLEQVLRGRADFALTSGGKNAAELETKLLCTDEFHLVCRRDHPLAKRRSVKPKDLAGYPFVHLARSSSVRQHLEAALHPLEMRTVLQVAHLATVAGMVQAGLGISVVPGLTLFHFQSGDLAIRPLEAVGLKRRIHLVKRRDKSLSIAAAALYELILESAR